MSITHLPGMVGPALGFYGDDFTGSTDAMEALAVNGVETVLFLHTPSEAEIEAVRGRYAAVGIAGISRSQDPAWMDAELPGPYDALRRLGAPMVHYKVCSTFDSSPRTGSIGRAIEIGRAVFGQSPARATPIIVGAPALRRYTAFGHLFAAGGEPVWRIDRHPTMSVHPVTPMNEADLLRHLAGQTALDGGLFDLTLLHRADAADRFEAVMAAHDMLLIDVLDASSQRAAGELLWQAALRDPARPLFCAGSSGVEYALIEAWRAAGLLPAQPPARQAAPVSAIAAVSGSCSPVTGRQIARAEADGFVTVRVAVEHLLADEDAQREIARVQVDMARAIGSGRSVLAYAAQGPDDPAIGVFRQAVAQRGGDEGAALAQVGQALGRILHGVLAKTGVARAAVAGGDTSGQVMQVLGLSALRLHAPLAPGVPLCDAYAQPDGEPVLQIALKGGQMGGERFFASVRAGRLEC